MQPVHLVFLKHLRGGFGVAHYGVKVKHSVECLRLPYPFVDILACSLAEWVTIVIETLEIWRYCRAVYLHTSVVRLLYELLITLYYLLCPLLCVAISASEVVYALKHHNGLHSSLLLAVAVESLHRRVAQSSEVYGISTDTQVEHGDIPCDLVCLEFVSKEICPSVLQICSRTASVRNRVTYYCDSLASLPSHVDGSNIIPMVLSFGILCKIRFGSSFTKDNR